MRHLRSRDGTQVVLVSLFVLAGIGAAMAQNPFQFLGRNSALMPSPVQMQSSGPTPLSDSDAAKLRDHMRYHYNHRYGARVVQGTTPPEFLQEQSRVHSVLASRAAVRDHQRLLDGSKAGSKDTPTTSTTDLNLGNTGLKADGSPVRGKIIGPFQSVRSTTIPWNMRHLLGQQVNGAPEPLVYSPIYTFQVTEKLRPTKPMEMFDNPNLYKMEFNTPSANMEVEGQQGSGNENAIVDPKAFEIVAPQPPPFVPPRPPGQGALIEQSQEASATPPPQDPAQ